MKSLFSTKYSDTSVSLGLLLLRIVFAGIMIKIGYDKLTGFNAIINSERGFMNFMGLGPKVSLGLVVFAEFFCAALVAVGLLTRLAAIPLIITMAVAFLKVHKGVVFGENNGQSALFFLVVFVVIMLAGPGKYSVDKMIGK
jgi:putative oxidoreductase